MNITKLPDDPVLNYRFPLHKECQSTDFDHWARLKYSKYLDSHPMYKAAIVETSEVDISDMRSNSSQSAASREGRTQKVDCMYLTVRGCEIIVTRSDNLERQELRKLIPNLQAWNSRTLSKCLLHDFWDRGSGNVTLSFYVLVLTCL